MSEEMSDTPLGSKPQRVDSPRTVSALQKAGLRLVYGYASGLLGALIIGSIKRAHVIVIALLALSTVWFALAAFQSLLALIAQVREWKGFGGVLLASLSLLVSVFTTLLVGVSLNLLAIDF